MIKKLYKNFQIFSNRVSTMHTIAVITIAFCVSVVLTEDYKKVIFQNTEGVTRIVGGLSARRYQFPYQASLQLDNSHICGASILTKRWLVTAGHCITASVHRMLIYAGILNLKENHPDVQVSRIARIIVHPNYAGDVNPNDIALVELLRPLRWTKAVQPINLPCENEEFSGKVWVSGWGYLQSQNPITPTRLQYVKMEIWIFEHCASNLIELIGQYHPLDSTMICVGGGFLGNEGACQGDSGGPLMQNGKLVGVASWNLTPCGTYKAPSVFTKVSKFIRFIREYVPGV